MKVETLNPFSVFQEEFSNENLAVRINAIRRLPLVIFAAGVNTSTIKELLAIIDEIFKNNDDDEVFMGLAESFKLLIGVIPLKTMIAYLESLLKIEETSVREKTVEAYNLLIREVSDDDFKNLVIVSINGLLKSASFISQISAINLIPAIFDRVNDEIKLEFIKKIGELLEKDESLILKRTLVIQLGKILTCITYDTLLNQIFNHFKKLCGDDSDIIRIATITSLIELAKVFSPEDNKTYLIPLIIQITGDKSWKVRHYLASEFHNLAEAVGSELTENSLISIFSTLLRDAENEVRVLSIKSLKKMIHLLSVEKATSLVSYITSIIKDSIPLVRLGCSEVLGEILKMNLSGFDKDFLKIKISVIIVEFINDKDIEVKIETIKLLPLWAKYVGTYILDLIASEGLKISGDHQSWRVRIAVIEAYSKMTLEFKNQKIFEKSIKKILIDGLEDKCYSVRIFTVTCIKEIFPVLEPDYIIDNIYKPILILSTNLGKFYACRITAIQGLGVICEHLKTNEKVKAEVIKTLFALAEDKVVNVRQSAIKELQLLEQLGIVSSNDQHYRSFFETFISNESDREIRSIVQKILKP